MRLKLRSIASSAARAGTDVVDRAARELLFFRGMHQTISLMLACAALFAACSDGNHTNGSRDSGVTPDAAANGDGGRGPAPTDLDDCFADLSAPETFFVEVQSFATEDEAIVLRRARKPGTRSYGGETFPYDLVRFGLASEEGLECVSRIGGLEYEFGHHNWDERWEAHGDRARYVVTEKLDVANLSTEPPSDDGWDDIIEAFSLASGERLWGPLELEGTGCYSLPYDLNPCMNRARTDQPLSADEQ